jgi:hypothetical protein
MPRQAPPTPVQMGHPNRSGYHLENALALSKNFPIPSETDRILVETSLASGDGNFRAVDIGSVLIQPSFVAGETSASLAQAISEIPGEHLMIFLKA